MPKKFTEAPVRASGHGSCITNEMSMSDQMKNLLLIVLLAALHGCYGLRSSQGGGETERISRKINPSDIGLPQGYAIEAVAKDLTFPTGITFDEDGEVYVVESGYSYGETWTEPGHQPRAQFCKAVSNPSRPWSHAFV